MRVKSKVYTSSMDGMVSLCVVPVQGDIIYTGFETDGSYGIVSGAQVPRFRHVIWYTRHGAIINVTDYSIDSWQLDDNGAWIFRGVHSYGYTEHGESMVEYNHKYMLALAYYVVIAQEAYTAQACEKFGEIY